MSTTQLQDRRCAFVSFNQRLSFGGLWRLRAPAMRGRIGEMVPLLFGKARPLPRQPFTQAPAKVRNFELLQLRRFQHSEGLGFWSEMRATEEMKVWLSFVEWIAFAKFVFTKFRGNPELHICCIFL